MSDFMRPADARKRTEFAGLGTGVLLGVVLATFGLWQTLTDAAVMPVFAVILGTSIAALSGLALARLAYMERRAARIRRRWSSRSRVM